MTCDAKRRPVFMLHYKTDVIWSDSLAFNISKLPFFLSNALWAQINLKLQKAQLSTKQMECESDNRIHTRVKPHVFIRVTNSES